MMAMTNNIEKVCENCGNESICKYVTDMKERAKAVAELNATNPKDPISISIRCQAYMARIGSRNIGE